MAIFVKYEGVDGESTDADHVGWTDVLTVGWSADNDIGGPVAGPTRRRGRTVVEDVALAFEYEKAAVKLQEACLDAKVFPKVEIEFTAIYGGTRVPYLTYELRNVIVTSYDFVASGDESEGPPRVVVENDFESLKVTYTEFATDGTSLGKVETEYRVSRRP